MPPAVTSILTGGVSMFEPIHGSAPNIRDWIRLNPLAAIGAVQMMWIIWTKEAHYAWKSYYKALTERHFKDYQLVVRWALLRLGILFLVSQWKKKLTMVRLLRRERQTGNHSGKVDLPQFYSALTTFSRELNSVKISPRRGNSHRVAP